ncbi:hypothetical protein DFH08DRAFT_804045 [Mycena albidolilacea]|uniref:Uncharacterized protein n=1 Tax=Mycena albidolilacea TaxID=1033008 RepID=A0AAD7AB61_9AGAR|nr:hypothetical protein DFH08DRAFT_804045 [Mycena albidolilacea]
MFKAQEHSTSGTAWAIWAVATCVLKKRRRFDHFSWIASTSQIGAATPGRRSQRGRNGSCRGGTLNADRRFILDAAKSLFVDDAAVWPMKMSQHYLGQIPGIQAHITSGLLSGMVRRRKLTSHLAFDWHMCSIRLAGRIFGSIQRTMAERAALT